MGRIRVAPRLPPTTTTLPPHLPSTASTSTNLPTRVAEVDSLSARAKMATKVFVRCVFAMFATNASLLRVIANL